MASTVYLINLRLEFDSKEARDKKYTTLKSSLADGKASDSWVKGSIYKDEYVVAEQAQETV